MMGELYSTMQRCLEGIIFQPVMVLSWAAVESVSLRGACYIRTNAGMAAPNHREITNSSCAEEVMLDARVFFNISMIS